MGAGVSTTATENDDGGTFSLSSETSLDDIPENCISSMMMNFDPQEICSLARVNKTFHRASSANFVWESKLPQNYKFLLNKSDKEEERVMTTMENKTTTTTVVIGGTNNGNGGTAKKIQK